MDLAQTELHELEALLLAGHPDGVCLPEAEAFRAVDDLLGRFKVRRKVKVFLQAVEAHVGLIRLDQGAAEAARYLG